VRSSEVRNALSPVFPSSTTRSGTSAEPTDAKACATSSSWPVIVWPFGIVTVTRRGEVLPPLWKASMILFAAVSPGCPGSEKSRVHRSPSWLTENMPPRNSANQTPLTIRR